MKKGREPFQQLPKKVPVPFFDEPGTRNLEPGTYE
jgi:hypothetical protein